MYTDKLGYTIRHTSIDDVTRDYGVLSCKFVDFQRQLPNMQNRYFFGPEYANSLLRMRIPIRSYLSADANTRSCATNGDEGEGHVFVVHGSVFSEFGRRQTTTVIMK